MTTSNVGSCSEMEALTNGALLTATVEQGEGKARPTEGDLVLHRGFREFAALCMGMELAARIGKKVDAC